MSQWRSVTSSGVRVTLAANVVGGPLVFANDPPITLEWQGRQFQGTYLDADFDPLLGTDVAVFMPGEDDIKQTFRVRRDTRQVESIATWRAYGVTGIRVSGVTVAMMRNSTQWCGVNGVDVRSVPSPPAPTSQGIACLVDGAPIFNDPARGRTVTVGTTSYHLPFWFESGEWICGINPPSDRVLAFHRGVVYLVTNAPQVVMPSGRQQPDGSLIVALQLGGDSPALFVASSAFVPLEDVPPEPEPEPDIPTFPPTDQRIGIGVFGDEVGPRIIGYTEPLSLNVRAIFYDTRDDDDDLDASLDLADEISWPVDVYKDGHGLDPDDVPEVARALVYAYPEEGMSVDESLERVAETLENCQKSDVPVDLCCAGYCQYRGPGDYALSQQKVLDMLEGAWDLAREHRVGAIWIFTKYRQVTDAHGAVTTVDGLDYWPALAEAVERMKRASADWLHFPPLETPPPPTEPQPDPTLFYPLRSLL